MTDELQPRNSAPETDATAIPDALQSLGLAFGEESPATQPIEVPIEEWTDCVVRVIADRAGRERQIFEQRMRLDASSASINASLPHGVDSISIEIDPGEHGPIQDRVIMHAPRVLIGE